MIVSPGRSGSTLLVERLRSHPEVFCSGEVVGSGELELTGALEKGGGAGPKLNEDTAAFLDYYLWRPRRSGTRAVGGKLLYNHLLGRLHEEAFLTKLKGVKIIHLQRRNRLKIYVSLLRAHQTGIFAHRGSQSAIDTRHHVDPVACEKFFALVERTEKYFNIAFADSDVLPLFYEDMVEDLPSYDGPLCGFLGVSQKPLSNSVKKMSSGSLADQIENWDEVCEYFKDGKWANFLL